MLDRTELWMILPALFIPFFIGVWLLVGYFIAALGGWRELAKRYAGAEHHFLGERWSWQNGAMRWTTRYANVLTVGADARGLYLAVMFLFRTGHPPLYVPWSEVALSETQGLFATQVRIDFLQVPGVYLQVSKKLGDRVARAGAQPIRGVTPSVSAA